MLSMSKNHNCMQGLSPGMFGSLCVPWQGSMELTNTGISKERQMLSDLNCKGIPLRLVQWRYRVMVPRGCSGSGEKGA